MILLVAVATMSPLDATRVTVLLIPALALELERVTDIAISTVCPPLTVTLLGEMLVLSHVVGGDDRVKW